MKLRKMFSVTLAVGLQVLPLTRVFVAATPATGSSFAIIATWLAGAAALLGGVDAVSGASSISISPTNATTGVPYSGIVQYSGSHASSAQSWLLRTNWSGAQSGCNTAYQIAPGLWLTNAATYLVRIGGTPTASGTYSFTMRISDSTGCGNGNTDTRSATITISGGTAAAPSITTQPVSQTVTAGGNATFTVSASGTAPLSYQWRLNGATVAGATTSALALTGVTAGQAGSYTVVVSNSAGSVTSSAATLTVNPAPVAPNITTQPVNQTVTAGGNATFTVSASGTAPLSYQWRLNGATVAGATTSALALTSVTAGQAGSYTVVVSNSAGFVTSSAAILTVNPASVAPSITAQPVNQTVTAGGNATFTVSASGTAPLSYQWRLNGATVAGATASALALTGVTAGQAGSYTVVVGNSAGSVTSSVATLTVNAAAVAPSITTQPVSQAVTAGGNATFTVSASGAAPLSYQWQQNGANVAGAATSALALTGVTAGQAGSYTVVVSNSAGSVTSSVATLTVNAPAVTPSITTQPVSQTVTAGGNVTFTVSASGTAPLSYQWRLNGATVAGATTSALALTGVTAGQAGSYTVVVSNSAGSVTSSVATLTVNAPQTNRPPVISSVGEQVTTPGTATPPIPFTIGDAETPASNLMLYGSSTNKDLVPDAGIFLGGTQSNRTVQVMPASGQTGCTEVCIMVSDGLATNSTRFRVTVAMLATNALTLRTNGNGIIWPALNPQGLVMGRSYRITAYPTAGQEFTGWTGSVTSASPTLTFVMRSNLVLQANFIPSPFIPVAGNYNGLFYEADAVRQASAGFWNLSLNRRGFYSGWLLLGSDRYTFAGRLGFDCRATNSISRPRTNALLLEIAVGTGADPDRLSGQLSSGAWTANLLGYRAVFNAATNPAPYAGAYTMALPGQKSDPSRPAGDGYGSMKISLNGQIVFQGRLADNTAVNQTAWISRDGHWPLFSTLNRGQGSLLGWLRFEDRSEEDVSGNVSWIKPADTSATYYRDGFSQVSKAIGSHYAVPASSTNSILQGTNAMVFFSGGNLTEDFANAITLGLNSRVTNLSSNHLSLNFVLPRGTYSGVVVDPATGRSRTFQGAVLQKPNEGFGFLSGTNQTSRVRIVPTEPAVTGP